MPYTINFTDRENKNPITVFDNTSNQDTSLIFPGRNVTGYGQLIGENFLKLLENFADNNQPVNPVEGQLWYDTESGVLQIFDNTNWRAASNIQRGPSEPSVEESNIGELWVDTANQQLRIYTGNRWLLVGPQESTIDGLRYGPVVETITDTNNINRSILILYLADLPVTIVSKDTFTPKVEISGYDSISAGINIIKPGDDNERAEFLNLFGGVLPKLLGTAETAESLLVGNTSVASSTFLRNDIVNTTEEAFNVRSNTGITLGVDGAFKLQSDGSNTAKIYNNAVGSSIDLQTNRNNIPTTILRVQDDKVGINKLAPTVELDLEGDFNSSGKVVIADNQESTNLSNGSFTTAGGASISKNLRVGTTFEVSGTSTMHNVLPKDTDQYTLGSSTQRWKELNAERIVADEIVGTIDGNITGNASTATNLKTVTSFQLAGDVTSPAIQFDGQVGSNTKIFQTTLTAAIIQDKDEPFPTRSQDTDFVLTYRSEGDTGLYKQTRDVFVGDLGMPMGAVIPFAGDNVPVGYLLCDGSEVEIAKFPRLFDIIGTTYNGIAPLQGINTFRVPDLRGRFALGRHNMDNGGQVPLTGSQTGAYVDAGGGIPSPARVEGTEATTLGASSGSNSVELTLGNLPEHSHDMQSNGIQYGAVKPDSAFNPPAVSGNGGTQAGQAQYLYDSGGIKKPNAEFNLGVPVGIMNPFLTINYIIRSGPPEFETTFT